MHQSMNESDIDDVFQLYQTYKNLQENVQDGLSLQLLIILLVFQIAIIWLKAFISNYEKN